MNIEYDWNGIATIVVILSGVLTVLMATFFAFARVGGVKFSGAGLKIESTRREPSEGINVRIGTPDGGEVAMTFPPGTDPDDVRRVVTDLLKQYQNVERVEAPPSIEDIGQP